MSIIFRWLGFRLEILGGLVVFAAAVFAVVGRNTISGGIVGLSISYALQVTAISDGRGYHQNFGENINFRTEKLRNWYKRHKL